MTKPQHDPDKVSSMLSTIDERGNLMERFHKALAHMDNDQRISILSSWMSLDALRECVEFQEEKSS